MKQHLLNRTCFQRSIQAVILLTALSALSLTGANAEEYRHHEAHEHGVARLNVAVEGNEVLIEFMSPAANIVGFEYEPKTAEQKTAVQQAIHKLEDGNKLFLFPTAAKSTLESAKVTTDIDRKSGHDERHEQDNREEAKEHEQGHAAHSDFKVEYSFHMDNPEELHSFEVLLCQVFPGIDHIDTQLLTATKQTAVVLTRQNKKIDL